MLGMWRAGRRWARERGRGEDWLRAYREDGILTCNLQVT